MMAAMAQQDCGQCGYNCKDYADAIVRQDRGAAESLRAGRQGNRPHAEDAARRDRHGARRQPTAPAPTPTAAAATAPATPAARATIRSTATFLSRTRLNKPGSEKETWHVEFDLTECGLDYAVGDAFGLFPTNDPALVDAVHQGARRAGGFPDRRRARCARC